MESTLLSTHAVFPVTVAATQAQRGGETAAVKPDATLHTSNLDSCYDVAGASNDSSMSILLVQLVLHIELVHRCSFVS